MIYNGYVTVYMIFLAFIACIVGFVQEVSDREDVSVDWVRFG